jgi:inositol 1,4,5-triphosphate receptor type 1
MVMELIKDNRKIVDRITTEHIDKFVELLRRDKVYTGILYYYFV